MATHPTTPRLLTVPQVAEMLAVSSSAVYSWAAEGYLPSVVMGRGSRKPVVRFRAEAIEQFIADREQEHRDSIDKRHSEKEDFARKVRHLKNKLDG